MLSTDKDRYSADEIEPLAPGEDKTVKNIGKGKLRAVNIPLENISASIGANIEITLSDGEKHSGTLVRATEDSISIEQQTSGGTVSFEYTLDKVKSVKRFTKPSNTITPPVVESGDKE
ncbi:MAG: hypothetical protein KJO81_03000 [Gammaproteobacteria bacterium]|nr:hypothetical protein [Gammaproteobacteria bacterium]